MCNNIFRMMSCASWHTVHMSRKTILHTCTHFSLCKIAILPGIVSLWDSCLRSLRSPVYTAIVRFERKHQTPYLRGFKHAAPGPDHFPHIISFSPIQTA